MKYQPSIVTAYYRAQRLPDPAFEYRFHPVRLWRFDIAWILPQVAIEVDGGIWIRGGHNRGAQMLKDWEKRNEAAAMGWRVLHCQPKDLLTDAMTTIVRRCVQQTVKGDA